MFHKSSPLSKSSPQPFEQVFRMRPRAPIKLAASGLGADQIESTRVGGSLKIDKSSARCSYARHRRARASEEPFVNRNELTTKSRRSSHG